MATIEKQDQGTIVTSWMPRALADEIKRHAERERRSVSAVVRLAVEDRLRADQERRR